MNSSEPNKNKVLKSVFEEDAKLTNSEQLSEKKANEALGLLTLIAIKLRTKIKLRALHAKQKSS